jgi:hypothetical protein
MLLHASANVMSSAMHLSSLQRKHRPDAHAKQHMSGSYSTAAGYLLLRALIVQGVSYTTTLRRAPSGSYFSEQR